MFLREEGVSTPQSAKSAADQWVAPFLVKVFPSSQLYLAEESEKPLLDQWVAFMKGVVV